MCSNQSEEIYLNMSGNPVKMLLKAIEEQLLWAESESWTSEDFRLLSEKVYESTGIKLSISTLKRVWGKVAYESKPSTSTLNALAQYIGYENFSVFKNQVGNQDIPLNSIDKEGIKLSKYMVSVAIIVILFFVVFGLSFLKSEGNTGDYDFANVNFSSRVIASSLPNTVIFNYNFGNNTLSKAQIQQSWNTALTFEVDQQKSEASCFYYYPGYFRAKLLADGNILREHDIKIPTDGWMATLGRYGKPKYLYYGELIEDQTLRLKQDLIETAQEQEEETAAWLTFHYYDSLPAIQGNRFDFEIRFRNTYEKSNGICKNVEMLVQGTESVFVTPFSIPGCTSELNLITAGTDFSGKQNDLSSLGFELSEWQIFRLTVKDGRAIYYMNNHMLFEKEVLNPVGEIVGFKLHFRGNGEVDYLKLKGENQITFTQEF